MSAPAHCAGAFLDRHSVEYSVLLRRAKKRAALLVFLARSATMPTNVNFKGGYTVSKPQAVAFFEEISKNNKLAQEVEKVVKGKNSDETKAKELLSLAKKYNFNFTKEEAASVQEALKKPLSTEEMLEVSGGKINLKSSLMAAAMLLGLGAGGATLSNMEASAGGPGAAQGQPEKDNANDDDSASITDEELRRLENDGTDDQQEQVNISEVEQIFINWINRGNQTGRANTPDEEVQAMDEDTMQPA